MLMRVDFMRGVNVHSVHSRVSFSFAIERSFSLDSLPASLSFPVRALYERHAHGVCVAV